MSIYRQSYDILNKIYRENSYSNLEMNKVDNPRVAKLVFGVLEKHYFLNYVIDELSKKTKPSVRIILLLSIYSLEFLSTPTNVVINETKELAEDLGKGAVVGYINAIIRKVADKKYDLPKAKDKNYNEVKYNLPSWLVGMYKKDYPNDYESIINAKKHNRVHIRLNGGTEEDTILKADPTAVKSITGYFVKNNKEISMLNYMGEITYQSFASTLIVEGIPLNKGDKVLDTCSAPGGKAIYLRQKGGVVTACDIHEHRLKLIESYAKRMGKKLDIALFDATEKNEKWVDNFDVVLADVPCSGMGTIAKKRDIIFTKKYEDIIELASIQKRILDNVKDYVKVGGALVYSTCTIFNKENIDNINYFLDSNDNFVLEKINLPFDNEGYIQFLPDGKGMEGFFVCLLRRTK